MKIITLLLVLIAMTLPAATRGNDRCLAEIDRLGALYPPGGNDFKSADAHSVRIGIQAACVKSTGDVRQYKAGLVYQLAAIELMSNSVFASPSYTTGLRLLTTSTELFANCAGGGDLAERCASLRDGTAAMLVRYQ